MRMFSEDRPNFWVALTIGNSRLHWALFDRDNLVQTWHTSQLQAALPKQWSEWLNLSPAFQYFATLQSSAYPELWLASVVPTQTEIWQHYPHATLIQLADIPLHQIYSTLGLDRAIALYGAGTTYGWPILAIDGGTALTITGVDATQTLIGGAILPGLGLQMRSIHEGTAGLPLVALPTELPILWAKETEAAIQSGIVWTAIAGLNAIIEQWCHSYPNSKVVLTGGDAMALNTYFKQWRSFCSNQWSHLLKVDSHLVFRGIAALRKQGSLAQNLK
jgi:type III pantothenate kinase